MDKLVPKGWKELSQAAAQERDPQKLMELIDQLNKALEEREAESKAKQRRPRQFISHQPARIDSAYLLL